MKTPRIGFRTIGFAATAVSAAYTYDFTARHLILAPVREAWWFVPMFDRWSRGDIPYDMIFGQEGEHRHPYVNLLCLVLATWTNWDLRAELIINVALLAVISAVCIASVSEHVERRLSLAHKITLAMLIPAATTSLVHWELLTCTFQMSYLMGFAAGVCAIGCLADGRGKTSGRFMGAAGWRLGMAAFFAHISSFSFIGGYFAWTAGFLMLLTDRTGGTTKMHRVAAWSALFFGNATVFFSGYHIPPHVDARPPISVATLRNIAEFMLRWIGQPVTPAWKSSLPAGVVLSVAFVAVATRTVRLDWMRRGYLRPEEGFSMGLAVFGIQIGLMTAVGRGAYGHAVYPRYTTPATLAVLGLALLASTAGAGVVPTRRRTGLVTTMAALWIAMLAANSLAGSTAMIGYQGRMLPAQTALWNGHGDIAPLAIKHPGFQSLVETARANRWSAATGRFR